MPVPPAELFAWHSRDGAFERLATPWQSIRVSERSGTIRDGDTITIRLRQSGVWLKWKASHENCIEGKEFTDRALSGPFPSWIHRHLFDHGPEMGTSVLRDTIQYKLPAGAIGDFFLGSKVANDLRRTFAFRHRRTRNDLLFHGKHLEQPRLRIAVSGWSGDLGRQLCAFLSTGGHRVYRITRSDLPSSTSGFLDRITEGPIALPPPGDELRWDATAATFLDDTARELDALIVLPERTPPARVMKEHGHARGAAANTLSELTRLVAALGRLTRPPRSLIVLSDLAYHGSKQEQVVLETSSPSRSRVGQFFEQLEAVAMGAVHYGVRVACLRRGRSPQQAALSSRPVAWISEDDLLAALLHSAWTSELRGPITVAAPSSGGKSDACFGSGASAWLRQTLSEFQDEFGESADAALLAKKTPIADPGRLLASGFEHHFTSLQDALNFECGLSATP